MWYGVASFFSVKYYVFNNEKKLLGNFSDHLIAFNQNWEFHVFMINIHVIQCIMSETFFDFNIFRFTNYCVFIYFLVQSIYQGKFVSAWRGPSNSWYTIRKKVKTLHGYDALSVPNSHLNVVHLVYQVITLEF